MSLAAVFPTTEIGPDAGAVRAWAQAVEEMGFDRVIAYDHVLGAPHDHRDPPLRGPYTEHDPFHEPLVLFGFLAAITQRVELMTGVLILPQRPVALVAKQAVEIDLLSGGRLVLGCGSGWNHVEYEALGTTFRDRARRFDEQVQVLTLLWDEALVDFTGTYHRIDRAGLVPRAGRPLPLWFGGSSDAALRRAVRWGSGFTFGTAGPRIEGAFGVLQGLLADAGRDPASMPTEAIFHAAKGTSVVAEEAAAWRRLGGTHLAISTMTNAALGADVRRCAGLDDHLAVLAEVRAALVG